MQIVDNEFKSLIAPLTKQEQAQLEQNILEDGIRDALVTWRGILLDGHNRLEIAQEHGLEYKTAEVELPDRDAAIVWIIRNQLGRRNQTPQQMSYLRGKLYEREKKTFAEAGALTSLDQNDPGSTADRIAAETGVSPATVKRDAKYAENVDAIDDVSPGARDKIVGAEVRLTKKEIAAIAEIAKQDLELARRVVEGEITVTQAKRELTKRQRKDSPPLPSDKYRVLYADSPWNYGNKGLDDYGHAERHYPTMTIVELCAMGDDIKAITDKDAVLFLWVTSPLLEECFPVIKAWGFKYKTSFVWDKIKHNFGHYNSVRHEFLLVCTRGSCTPDVNELFDSVQSIEKSRTHSEKPEAFRAIIDTIYTHGKRLELFARTQADGWETWGNESR